MISALVVAVSCFTGPPLVVGFDVSHVLNKGARGGGYIESCSWKEKCQHKTIIST